MSEVLRAIILAAGKGTRMNDSENPKCAVLFCGKPMINYIIDACKEAGVSDIVVVVGYKAEKMIACLPSDVKYVIQETQEGTGHATKCAEKHLRGKDGITLIFPGDMPLVTSDMIKGIVRKYKEHKNALTIMTTVLDDPGAYGRIYRENNNVRKIVEFKDCNEEQKKIKEINVGVYAVGNEILFNSLDLVKNDNNAHEYYLTDIVQIISGNNIVDSFVVKNDCHAIGINDVETLKRLEVEYRAELNK